MRLDTNALLLSKRVKEITYDPFCLFQASNYLPAEMYQALLESFPQAPWFVEQTEGDKRRRPDCAGDRSRGMVEQPGAALNRGAR